MGKRRPADATEDLKDLVYPGLTEDVYNATQGLAFVDALISLAVRLQALNLGPLFGPLRSQTEREIFLSLAKVFEQPSAQYTIRSIPSALEFMEAHCRELPIPDRPYVEQHLARLFRAEVLSPMTPEQLTRTLVAHFRLELPEVRRARFHPTSKTLSTLRILRDKHVAHNEKYHHAVHPFVQRSEVLPLLEYAQDFVTVVGQGYLSLVFQMGDGHRPFFSTDAGKIRRALERLVEVLDGKAD